jgi:hypothetical protein
VSKPTTIAELKTELAETDKRLTGLRTLVARRDRLAALIRQWEALYDSPAKKTPKKHPAAVTKMPEPSGTTGYALHVLRTKGPSTLDEILQESRRLGWVGSGNDAVDKKRLYAAMFSKPEECGKGPDGKWRMSDVAKAG